MELTSSPELRRRVRTMVAAGEHLLRLWREDLLSFLSPSLRRSFAKLGRSKLPMTILCDQDTIIVDNGTASLEQILVRARSEFVILKIDHKHVMCREMEVPSAVAASLDTALSMNIGVWTPFTANDIYALAQQTIPNSFLTRSTLSVPIEIRCASRVMVDKHIGIAQSVGIDPDIIQFGDGNFILMRATKKGRVWRWQGRLLMAMIFVLIAQIAGFSMVVFGKQAAEIDRLVADQSHLKQLLRQKAQAEKQAIRNNELMSKIVSRMGEAQSVSQAIQVLARALPAGVVVLEFEISRDRGDGHLIVLGPKELDLVTVLSSTKMYRPRDLSATSGADDLRRTYSVGFTLAGWEAGTNGTRP